MEEGGGEDPVKDIRVGEYVNGVVGVRVSWRRNAGSSCRQRRLPFEKSTGLETGCTLQSSCSKALLAGERGTLVDRG